jgi:hypothetical protein
MYNKLRYQEKRHAISEKLLKEKIKFMHILPHFFLMLNKKIKKKKKKKKKKKTTTQTCLWRN